MDIFSQLSTTDMAKTLLTKISLSIPCRVNGDESLHSHRAVLHELDKTISSMKSLVRGRLNSLCDINRLLPPGVLARVFAYIGPASTNNRYWDHFDVHRDLSQICDLSATGDLNPLQHVPLTCRYWRDVAFSTPSLWSDLIVGEVKSKSSALPLAASRALATSKVPLYVTISRYPSASAARELVNKLGSRVEECIFHGVCTRVVTHTLSIGENLRVCAFSHTNVLDPCVLLFDDRTSKLKVLYISHGVFLPMNHFPSLTTLILDNGGQSGRGGGFTFEEFSQLLGNCAALHSLYLRALPQCFKLTGHPPILTSTSVITLPHLRRLSILEGVSQHQVLGGSSRASMDLFRLLLTALQPQSRASFVWLSSATKFEIEETLKPLAHLLPSMNDLNFMRIDQQHPYTWNSLSIFELKVVSPHRSQGFRTDFPQGDVDGTDLRAALSLLNVRRLWITRGANVLAERPTSVLQALPHVTTLVLMGFFERRITAIDCLAACEGEATPCPELHTLCVYLRTDEHGKQLWNALHKRTNDGFPISRLVVCLKLVDDDAESVMERVQSCKEFVHDLTIVPGGQPVLEELLWERVVPYECSHPSQVHQLWETWA